MSTAPIKPLSRYPALLFAVIILLLVNELLTAQTPHQTENLLRISSFHGRQFEIEKSRAIRLADSLNIPVRQRLTDGRIIELMSFEEGMPVYYVTHNAGGAVMIGNHLIYPGAPSGLNLTGEGQTLGIWDEGWVMENHQEFLENGVSRVRLMDEAEEVSFHATHVGGTMAAAGIDSTARGMSWRAYLDSYDWNDDISEMAAAAAGGLKVSQHSYGAVAGWSHGSQSGEEGWHWFGDVRISEVQDYTFGFYSHRARAWDDVAYHAPNYLIVKSAGNDRNRGPDPGERHYVIRIGDWRLSTLPRERDGGNDGYNSMPGSSNSKNLITVGAVLPNSSMAGFSGWGPTDDGRIKPDIVAKGVSVYSPVSTGTASYSVSGGTSMAGPMISGSVGLLLEHQENLNPGEPLLSSTLKALIIHTADDAISGAPGPDYRFGWGLMNTNAAVSLMSLNHQARGIHIIEDELAGGGNFTVPVMAGEGPLRATLVWTDVPGSPPPPSLNPPDLMLVNDLDMRITGNNQEFMPYILDPENPTLPAQSGDNFRDNVEMVHIDSPAEGRIYLITIGHKDILNGESQAFSLVISGNEPITLVAPPPVLSARPAGLERVAIEWSPNGDQNQVLLLWSPNNTFGIPREGEIYEPGHTLPDGGTVLYTGDATSLEHTGLEPATTYYYRIFSVDEFSAYSNGIGTKAFTDCGLIVSLPFREDFDASKLLPACWHIKDHHGNDQVWQIGVHPRGLSGTTGNYAFINSHEYDSESAQNSSLVSPEFDFSGFTEITLSFTHYFRKFDRSAATLYLSTDNGETWEQLQQWTDDTDHPAFFRQVIPGAARQAGVQFKWNYSGSGEWFWNVDDVEITGTPLAGLPAVITSEAFDIGPASATSGGIITDQGDSEITVMGVVWSSLKVPTVDENEGIATGEGGTGEFTVQLSGLTPGTTYFIRAWATNNSGTFYGDQVVLQTPETPEQFKIDFRVTDRYGNPVPDVKVAVTRGTMDSAPIPLHKSVRSVTAEDYGEWIHWDDGMFDAKIGMNQPGTWTSAIRFEPADLQDFEGMIITRVRLVVHDPANNATLVIWQGTDQDNLTEKIRQQFIQSEKIWVNVELDNPYAIDNEQELWIGVEWDDPGEDVYPAGVDESTGHDGKGNLIITGTYPDGWASLAGFPVSGDWNLQAFVMEKPLIVLTNEDGSAVFEKNSGKYTFTVLKNGYEPVSGNFEIRASDKTIEVSIYEHFDLNLVSEPPESGTFTGAGQYREGARANITAVAAQGYLFMYWSGDTQYLDNAQLETTGVTMPGENISLTANFDLVISAGNIISGETGIFPNPFSGSLTINNASGISRIVFTDIPGTVIMDRRLDGSEMHTIDTTTLPPGLYLVILYDREGRKEIRRMIKID